MTHLDDLSATDRAFLDIEGHDLAMHVGAVVVLGPSDLVGDDGAVDFARIAAIFERELLTVPRFRQTVARVPGLGAAWVDDASFCFAEHVHRAAALRPGSDDALFELAGAIFSRPLQLGRPLWEMWIVEGLAGGRLALIFKAHHALVDGMGGLAVLASMLRLAPDDARPRSTAAPHLAAPPSRLELVGALAQARVRHVTDLVQDLRTALAKDPRPLAHARDVAAGLLDTLRTGLSPASETVLNPATFGHHRTFAGVRLDLGRLRAVRTALGGTVNDLAVAIVTGALRRVIARMGQDPDTIGSFRALVPVNLRERTGESGLGNHISLVLADLPIAEPGPRARHARVRASLDRLKGASHEVEGTAFFEKVGDLAGPNLVSLAFSIAMRLRAFNVVVTNMVGPPVPLFLARAQVEAIYPLVPLFSHQGISVALLGYAGALQIGLFADQAVVADLGVVGADLVAAFEELEQLAPGAR